MASGPSRSRGHTPRLTYQPALDGVRALAVVAVLLFHAGVPGFDGGYLGVSVFFTLSGYLITSLLVNEHDQTGRIDLGAFYGRRLRRLLPASVLAIAAITLASWLTDWFDGVSSLRAQIWGSLFQVANWVLLAGDGSYQELLAETNGSPSPLEHFWSLAIEEQFYWVWPVAMLALLSAVGSRRGRVTAVGAITMAFTAAAPVIAAVWGADAAYWATPARLAEILVGAFLAVVLAGRTAPTGVAPLAPIALAGLAAAVVLFPAAGGPAYEGALPLVALGSGALLLGLQADGPLRAVLGVAPLVWVGRISYGIYLFHWPVYVVLDAERAGFDGAPLVLARLGVTLAISVASFHLVEQPIRTARGISFRPTLVGSLTATSLTALGAAVVVPAALGNYWETDAVASDAAAIEVIDAPLVPIAPEPSAPATSSTPAPPTTVPAPTGVAAGPDGAPATTSGTTTTTTVAPIPELARPVRALVVGDSTAEAVGSGLVAWAAANPDTAQVELDVERGCGFLVDGDRLVGRGWEEVPARCDDWIRERVISRATSLSPDVVVLMVTPWDVIDRRWDGADGRTPFDDDYAARLAADYETLVAELVGAGVPSIVWVEPPVPNPLWMNLDDGQTDPRRYVVVEDVVDGLAAHYPIRVLPFATWHTAAGLDLDRELRPDGVHWTPEVSQAISEEYLGEQVVRAALGLGFSS